MERSRVARHFCKGSDPGCREFEQRRRSVIPVFGEAQQPGSNQIACDALHRLPRDSEPAGSIWDATRLARRNAEQLPTRLRLILALGNRLADAPKVPRRFKHVGDQQCKFFLALDNMLAYWHSVTTMVSKKLDAVETLKAAFERAAKIRPVAGGFPVLAEVLRAAGVLRNEWHLPGAQSRYDMTDGAVLMQQLPPRIDGISVVPPFDRNELIRVLRADQAGETTFPAFLDGVGERVWCATPLSFLNTACCTMGLPGPCTKNRTRQSTWPERNA